MRQNVSWSLEGLDADTRDAAKEAARRAGMSLDDWLNATISDRAARAFAEAPAVRRRAPAPAPDELEAVTAKIAKVTRGRQPQGRDLDTILSAANAETERRARENAAKTAVALDSVARWIERAEDRISETSRIAAERQDRTNNVLGEALGLMTRRLDDIERKVVEGHQPSMMAALKAVEKVEQQLAKFSDSERSQAQNTQIETALRGFEERIATITERLAATAPRPMGRRGASIQDELKGAVAEIRSRQRMLDELPEGVAGPAAAAHAVPLAMRTHGEALTSLRGDIARLAAQLDSVRPEPARQNPAVDAIRGEIARLQASVSTLATKDEVGTLERALRDLSRDVAQGGRTVDLDGVVDTIADLQAEVRRLSEAVTTGLHARLSADLAALDRKIDGIARSGVDDAVVDNLAAQLSDVRSVLSDIAEPRSVTGLAEQVADLSRQMAQIARSQVDAIEFASLRNAVDDIRTTVKKAPAGIDAPAMMRHFETLARKLDGMSERLPTVEGSQAMSRQVDDLTARLDAMMTRLSQAGVTDMGERIDTLTRHVEALPATQLASDVQAINRQFETLWSRLDEMSSLISREDAGAMAGQIEAFSRQLASLSGTQIADGMQGLSRQLDVVSARLDEAARASKGADLSPISAQLADLGRQMAQQGGGGDDVLRRIDALSAKLDAIAARPLEPDLTPLARQLEEIGQRVASRESGTPVEDVIDRIDALSLKLDQIGQEPGRVLEREFERLQRGMEEVLTVSQSAPPVRDDLRPLEDMLRALASKLDTAERRNAEPDSLDALESQIAELSRRLERGTEADPALTSLERSMGDLMAQIETMRDGAVEVAERAAKTAIADTLGALPRAESAPAPDMSFLTQDLAELKASHHAAERRSRDTLEAVHETLEKLVARLAGLEQEALRPRIEPKLETPQPQVRRPRAPQASRDAVTAGEPGSLESDTIKQLEAAAKAHMAAAAPVLSEADRPVPPAGSIGDDVLLEPGSGRPLGDHVVQGPELETGDVKASFIAAARRAAQAAAAEAAAVAGKNYGRAARAERDQAAVATSPASLASRMKQVVDRRRRPLLLGIAAIILAIGAMQIAAPWRSDETVQVAQPATDALPQAAPPLPQASAGQGVDEPKTTQALASPKPIEGAAPIRPPAFAAGVPARDIVGGVATPALAGEATSAETKPADAVGPEPKTAPATLAFIPNMAEVASLPANAGPAALRKAVLAGDPLAVYEYASRAAEGRGMMRDMAVAARLFERVASHGLIPAQYRIGNHYEKGLGVTRDLTLAKTWYQRAADAGNARAMHNLAVLVAEGAGGKPDYATAVGWFRRAAEFGIRDSQYNLAVLLARGLGTAQDLPGSYTWFAIAAQQGDADAGKKRDEVASRLNASELALAQAAVERWRPEAPDRAANEVSLPAHGWDEPVAKEKPRAKNV